MIKSTKFLFTLKLTFLIAFFITTLSQLLLMYSVSLGYFIENTFLATLGYIINSWFFSWAFIALRTIGIFLIVGCMIGIVLIFYYDVMKEQKLT